MLKDVLPKPIDSPKELEKMSAGLSDEEIKKKTVRRSFMNTATLFHLCNHVAT